MMKIYQCILYEKFAFERPIKYGKFKNDIK